MDIKGFALKIDENLWYEYLSANVKIEISPIEIIELSCDSKFKFIEKTVFLKKVLGGEIPLYLFKTERNHLYLQDETGKLELLLYKTHLVCENRTINTRKVYQQQLKNLMKDCSSLKVRHFKDIDYNSQSIAKILIKYYECTGDLVLIPEKRKKKKKRIRLNVTAGIGLGTIDHLKPTSAFLVDRPPLDFKFAPSYHLSIGSEFFIKERNENLSFSTNILFSYLKVNSTPNLAGSVGYHTLPLLGAGFDINIYVPKKPEISFTFGFNYFFSNLNKDESFYLTSPFSNQQLEIVQYESIDNSFFTFPIKMKYHLSKFSLEVNYSFGLNPGSYSYTDAAAITHTVGVGFTYSFFDSGKKK
jgi:hypothetical protein